MYEFMDEPYAPDGKGPDDDDTAPVEVYGGPEIELTEGDHEELAEWARRFERETQDLFGLPPAL